MIKAISNLVMFQMAWFAAIFGGARGWSLTGSIPAIVVVTIHLWINRHYVAQETLLIIGIVILGVIVEVGFVSLGALHYEGTSANAVLPPIWIMALWFAFGTLPHGSLSWLSGRLWLQLFLGGVFGPLSYLGGARLGAATLLEPTPASLFIIGVGWALAIVLMFQAADKLKT